MADMLKDKMAEIERRISETPVFSNQWFDLTKRYSELRIKLETIHH